MSVSDLQTALTAAGYDTGGVDGMLGPNTYTALIGYTVSGVVGPIFRALGAGLAASFPTYAIDQRLRAAHWIGQAAHETGGFNFLTELGDDAYFAKYDGRVDLGNTQPGDGAQFRGRGLFQITGRANYAKYGTLLSIDLIGNPQQAAEPGIAVQTACLFWNSHNLNPLADANDGLEITRAINGGTNGLDERLAYAAKIKAIWPAN